MRLINLTDHNVIIQTDNSLLSVAPDDDRFDVPHPRSELVDVGFESRVRLFRRIGKFDGFHANDIVIVDVEQFAYYQFDCEVWVATALGSKGYMNVSQVQKSPPAVHEEEPVLEFTVAVSVVSDAVDCICAAHGLDDNAYEFIKGRVRYECMEDPTIKYIELANDKEMLGGIVKGALTKLGIEIH